MPFMVLGTLLTALWSEVTTETPPASSGNDMKDAPEPPLVGFELAATWGRERAFSHG